MQIFLLKIENITWDGIVQASATILVLLLSLFFNRFLKWIEEKKKEKEKLKELGYILKILITIPVSNTYILENFFQKLTKFDENILQTIGLRLITTEESLNQIFPVNQYHKPQLPLLYCDSDINHPCIIAYPNFQNWNTKSNAYSVPGSLTSDGGFSMELSPIQDGADRKKIWESVKKQAKTYGFKLEFKKNREERKSYRRNRKRSQENYFNLCNIIKTSLELILLEDEQWTKTFYSLFQNSDFDRIRRDLYPMFGLLTEKRVYNLYFQAFKRGKLFEETQEMEFRIGDYEFNLDGCINKKNGFLLIKARKEQLDLTANQDLDQVEIELITKMVSISSNQDKFQEIFDKWIKNVAYCKVPRRYRKILPLKKRIYIRVKNEYNRFKNKEISLWRFLQNVIFSKNEI